MARMPPNRIDWSIEKRPIRIYLFSCFCVIFFVCAVVDVVVVVVVFLCGLFKCFLESTYKCWYGLQLVIDTIHRSIENPHWIGQMYPNALIFIDSLFITISFHRPSFCVCSFIFFFLFFRLCPWLNVVGNWAWAWNGN